MNSVCMATFNGAKYVKAQVQSILMQLREEDELVISDNGSSDGTLEVIGSFRDDRIRTHRYTESRGPIKNFENAVRHARGDFIFLSDQDDLWLPEKRSRLQAVLESGIDVVVSDCRVVDEAGAIVCESFFSTHGSRPGFARNLIRNSYLGCCMAFSRRVLDRALPFPEDVGMHDIWIGMVGEAFYSTRFVSEVLMVYKRHSGNASTTSSRSSNTIGARVRLRLALLMRLAQRVPR